jgi:hypothetical protein
VWTEAPITANGARLGTDLEKAQRRRPSSHLAAGPPFAGAEEGRRDDPEDGSVRHADAVPLLREVASRRYSTRLQSQRRRGGV